MPQELRQAQVQELLVLLAMPQRLPLLQQVQVPLRLEKAQLQGKALVQGRAVAKLVVVACVWVTVNPALGVTTKLRDVTLRLRSPDYCLG